MRKSNPSQSPLLTPQTVTPVVAGGYSTKLWDQRAPKYSNNVMMRVCIFLFIVTFCEELAGYGVNQSLKNFFQKLGWSNKGSNSMKLTYDSLSQFACIAAAFIADQYLGKYKTILAASSVSSIGFVLITVAAVPSVLDNQMLSKVLFCIGVFLGIALNQVGIRALLIPFGGDQFSPASPPEQRASYFSINFWASNLGVAINYAVFPSLCLYGIGAIPADYGYVTVFAIGLALMLSIIVNLLSTRSRYINVPPTESALGSVIHVIIRSARHSLNAKMMVLGTILYVAAFFLNIIAAFMSDDGETGHNISYVCGVMIVVATILWIYFGQDLSMVDGATDSDGIAFDQDLIRGVKQVLRILPFNAFNMFWWVCQNQRGNNQTIIQQTDVRLGSSPDSTQIPAPTVQFFNPGPGLLLVPFFHYLVYPIYEKFTGKPPSRYGMVAAGYVVAIVAMVWTGVFEIIRRDSPLLTYVDTDGEMQYIYNNNGGQPMSDIRWYNAIPQYIFVAAATVLIQIPTYNIAYTEVPMALRGVSVALGLFMNSMGSTLLSVIVLLFGKDIPANLNDGHMENMYFTIAGVMAVNAIFYLVVMNKMQFAMIPSLGKEPTDNETDDKDVPFELASDRRSIN
ncbi:Protein NRT1/ PTR FAMILY 8.2 [Phytophthora citrophthora]|uniref:Protein NRT1/ PTR FAMILY 8.2 n=1 Tax=Phytophthora citrophthora TaxID=4793 RepID=A0AAD9GJ10_9STRA|nr:Protein NRT1/ PTR FAMILY 8.2 [Phytophthora citrophthora]